MEDTTSPTPTNSSSNGWPTPAVPGEGIPWRRGDQANTRSAASGTAEQSADVEARGPQPPAEANAVGDRPRDVPVARSPQAAVPVSTLGANPQANSVKAGTGPQGTAVAPGDRDGDRGHGPRRPLGTDGPGEATAQQDRTGPVDPRGPEHGTGSRPLRGPADHAEDGAGEGAELLDEVRAAIGKYVVLPSEEALTAVTLWVAATHIQTVLQHAPRLAVVGPTKGCGKSRVLDVLHETVHKPMMTVNTSPAVVFRVIGKNPPTLLVDEADTIFGPKAGDKEDLRGLLNAGHQRNRPAWRISGPEHKPTAYPTFAMAALAGIGDLPDTIMDRAVVLRMQKRKPGEKVAQFRSRNSVPELNALRDRLTAWLGPLRGTASRMVPTMPVQDRAADTWEPLVIIAHLAGGHWPARAHAACVAMTRYEAAQDDQTSLKTRLLRDIHRIFQAHGNPEALSTQALIADLLQDPDAPWAEHGTKGLNAYHLGNMLRDFGISPANHRFNQGRQAKAYARNRFLDAWARHCPDLTDPAPTPAHEAIPVRPAQGKPPAAPAGSLPISPPSGTAGPKRAH